jgi:FkbM family methyltransferase
MFTAILKRRLRDLLKNNGYQISKISTLESEVKSGKYVWLQEMGIRTVLDVGANVGSFTKMISVILDNINIYAFEPLPDCYTTLIKNTEHLENVTCLNCALGDTNSEGSIYHNEFSPSSSLLKMKELHKEIFPQTKNAINENIRIRELDSFDNEINWTRKILLKIDVQGFEMNVLKGADSSLKKIDIIIVEILFVELYENQTRFDDIYKFLYERNFSYKGNFNQVADTKTGRIIYADAIFIKS